MAETVQITGKINVPPEDGQPTAPIDLGLSFIFTQSERSERVYAAPVTDDPVSLGTLASGGAKLLIVKCPTGGCTIKLNGGTVAFPVAASSGYVLFVNPSAGVITALTVSVTGPAKVSILALA